MEHTLTKAKNRRLIWGLGGTILSGLGLVGLALFEQGSAFDHECGLPAFVIQKIQKLS